MTFSKLKEERRYKFHTQVVGIKEPRELKIKRFFVRLKYLTNSMKMADSKAIIRDSIFCKKRQKHWVDLHRELTSKSYLDSLFRRKKW